MKFVCAAPSNTSGAMSRDHRTLIQEECKHICTYICQQCHILHALNSLEKLSALFTHIQFPTRNIQSNFHKELSASHVMNILEGSIYSKLVYK